MSHKTKVGTLPFQRTANHGVTFQAYALRKTIKRQECDVEFTDYQPYGAIRHYLKEVKPTKTYNGVPSLNKSLCPGIPIEVLKDEKIPNF